MNGLSRAARAGREPAPSGHEPDRPGDEMRFAERPSIHSGASSTASREPGHAPAGWTARPGCAGRSGPRRAGAVGSTRRVARPPRRRRGQGRPALQRGRADTAQNSGIEGALGRLASCAGSPAGSVPANHSSRFPRTRTDTAKRFSPSPRPAGVPSDTGVCAAAVQPPCSMYRRAMAMDYVVQRLEVEDVILVNLPIGAGRSRPR